jgi:hypothetical protein
MQLRRESKLPGLAPPSINLAKDFVFFKQTRMRREVSEAKRPLKVQLRLQRRRPAFFTAVNHTHTQSSASAQQVAGSNVASRLISEARWLVQWRTGVALGAEPRHPVRAATHPLHFPSLASTTPPPSPPKSSQYTRVPTPPKIAPSRSMDVKLACLFYLKPAALTRTGDIAAVVSNCASEEDVEITWGVDRVAAGGGFVEVARGRGRCEWWPGMALWTPRASASEWRGQVAERSSVAEFGWRRL